MSSFKRRVSVRGENIQFVLYKNHYVCGKCVYISVSDINGRYMNAISKRRPAEGFNLTEWIWHLNRFGQFGLPPA